MAEDAMKTEKQEVGRIRWDRRPMNLRGGLGAMEARLLDAKMTPSVVFWAAMWISFEGGNVQHHRGTPGRIVSVEETVLVGSYSSRRDRGAFVWAEVRGVVASDSESCC